MKILVIHHARSLEDRNAYLTDEFREANIRLFGAQELDTWAGIRLLAINHEVDRLEVCPNKSTLRLVDSKGAEKGRYVYGSNSTFKKYFDLGYIRAIVKYTDPSVARQSISSIRNGFNSLVEGSKYDLHWWDTQFYDSLIDSDVPSIVRSVNFEPNHVLAEDPSIFRFIRSIGKRRSEKKISMTRNLISISPKDYSCYAQLGRIPLANIPLRQLSFIVAQEFPIIYQTESFLTFGSTYQVLHNRRNLNFLIREIAPALFKVRPEIELFVYGNRIPNFLNSPPNIRFAGFDENLQAKQRGSTGVIIPFHGGAGMQSKLFEPLSLGAAVIANPENLAGYDYRPNVHYVPATNVTEYINAIIRLNDNPDFRERISLAAKQKSRSLFNLSEQLDLMEKSLAKVVADKDS